MSSYSPGIPTSFDPALLHSELEFIHDQPVSESHSDEFDALQQCIAQDKAKKNSEGVVIQHRAWNLTEIFRSEGDRSIDTPLKRQKHSHTKRFPAESSVDDQTFPSSPPLYTMPLISSPVAYPPSSSMPQVASPKKRKRPDDARSPLKDLHNNQPARKIGGFLDDSDDEDDVAAQEEHMLKRRALNSVKDLPVAPEGIADYTPPASQDEAADPETIPVDALDQYRFESLSPVKRTQPVPNTPTSALPVRGKVIRNAAGKAIHVQKKANKEAVPYEQLIASRSVAEAGKARTDYYGLNIHELMDEAKAMDVEKAANKERIVLDLPEQSIEQPVAKNGKSNRTLMWTEKYRAKKFTDLVGDERTHRSVLRWLKGWDPVVFPGSSKAKSKGAKKNFEEDEQRHRKVLLLTGPPGLGKTTLAHVCARQAGYEVQEINASDERSGNVVKGRIRDMVGTENVRGVNTSTANGKVRKAGKPVCVIVDEVDGVVGGSGASGEGGFVKALIDLINLDEKNSKTIGQHQSDAGPKKKKKGDRFRMLRPLILICNDVYHPSLRPLRQSSLAEVVHIRKPALNMVVTRMHDIFIKEGFQCDSDGVRRLCEATWGVSTKKEGGTGSGTGEGDIRGVMVVGEWIAGRLRSSHDVKSKEKPHLTRRWIEDNFINDLRHGGGAARSLGRGGAKDAVERVFKEGAGFPKQAETTDPRTAVARAKNGVIGVAESAKRRAMERLREMVDTSGDCDRIISDCFTAYPEKPFQDDTLLSKPNSAYEWLHFHDTLSTAVHGSQEWELAPYLSQSILAFHDLFASPRQASSVPTDPDAQISAFSGPGANFAAVEQLKSTRAGLMGLQSSLSIPLTRSFRSPEEMSQELIPYVLRMLSPDVKPVIVNTGPSGSKSFATASVRKASEKALVKKAVEAMAATGVRFERSRVEIDDVANRSGGFVWRMEPPLDTLASFETLSVKKDEKVRYAVRSVLEQEWRKESARMDMDARKRRGGQTEFDLADVDPKEDVDPAKAAIEASRRAVKRDFFGRVIKEWEVGQAESEKEKKARQAEEKKGDHGRIWVSFNEGFSNAVRKPVTIDELLRGL
ncbi:chromosome transmission fidelity protein 18 [Dothidotthia symphoricarpi CBS 119687]|uniref:Chromosome transmission fidelity protein 18 n=1 Tax=Dothidotthia symphoricarpi CBS 119687 TaxID=1392245 RepID=A0A6A6A6L6_9PLEO|nr:chromosome transmission fidelity protein 18 [Dothidotthia symphoricarpi CBS 119687]KAF2127529.1 chromosome transmission fidelity protein 18 [Dothidotthia symphoricarpi CBS 119687]